MQECNPARNSRLRLIETGEEPGTEQDNVPSPTAKVPHPDERSLMLRKTHIKSCGAAASIAFIFPFVLQQPFPRL
jgi:hypothetical protein